MNRLVAALTTLLLAGPALAEVNLARCDDDGITETPWFGNRPLGGANCLYVDPGNGGDDIPFQYEFFHQPEENHASIQCDGVTQNKLNIKITDDGCPDKTTAGCNLLLWDLFIDNYAHAGCKNTDIIEFGYGHKNMWIKDSVLANTVACKGASGNGSPGWNGPNGLSCAPNEDSAHHTDGIQSKSFPNWGGWFVIQDTIFVNGYNEHSLFQRTQDFGARGSLLIQGGTYGRLRSIGQATDWIADCQDMQGASETSDICTQGQSNWGYPFQEIWIVDVHAPTDTLMDCNANHGKCVIVNTGCNKTTGCDGTIGYNDGWAHPMNHPGSGPGTCPNGQIGSNPPIYCYTSLEEAALDHTLPPFAQYSCAGWETHPATCTDSGGGGGGGGGSDDVAIVTSVTSPVTANVAHTITGTVTNNDGTTTVEWDCDGDGAFDDGTDDTSVPYSQVCTAISTPGSYTVGAKVTDQYGNDEDTALLIVNPICGNNVQEGTEVCDGTDLNGLDCTEDQFGSFTGGTLACESDCSAYDVASCTGGSPSSCGDGFCDTFGSETNVTCFEDCARSSYSVLGEQFDGWDYFIQPMYNGVRLDRAKLVDQNHNVIAEPISENISGYRFIVDSDEDSPYSLIQNSPMYSMCGDTGVQVSDALPCTPPLPRGTHTIAITPCNTNWSGTFDAQPFPDSRCTSGGGKLGPTETISIIVIYKQASKFIWDSVEGGMTRAFYRLVTPEG